MPPEKIMYLQLLTSIIVSKSIFSIDIGFNGLCMCVTRDMKSYLQIFVDADITFYKKK